jgi:2-methylisocitrate lyase-like PEP mutase family enzyme
MTSAQTSRAQELRRLIGSGQPVAAPGAHDPLSARLVERAGFAAGYVTGSGLAGTMFGWPDASVLSFGEFIGAVRRIADAVAIPLIVDADTGFGGPMNVIRTVRELESAGVAAAHLEDQTFPRRCGYVDGGGLVPTAEMCARIRIALDARRSPDFLVIARTEAKLAASFDETVERACAYRAAGADMIFVNGMTDEEQARRAPAEIPGPHLYNYSGSDLAPKLTATQIGELGYAVVIYPIHAARAATRAIADLFAHLKATGDPSGYLDRLATRAEWEDLTLLPEVRDVEARYRVGDTR